MFALPFLVLPIFFNDLEPIQADELKGKKITVRLQIGSPSFTWKGRTITGAGEQPDGISRTVTLKGRRDLEPGDVITVTGFVRIILHPRSQVNGVIIPAWTELRLDE